MGAGARLLAHPRFGFWPVLIGGEKCDGWAIKLGNSYSRLSLAGVQVLSFEQLKELAEGLRRPPRMDGAILLIDQDLGRAFRLGRALDHAGFETFPARTVSDAEELLRRLHLTVDVLMFDCDLPGTEEFIARLERGRKVPRVICLNGYPHHSCVRGTHMLCPIPAEFSEDSMERWVRGVRELLLYSSSVHV